EIIIAGFALHAGLVDMVKSSLTGSIIGNLLFGLGVAFFAGGIKQRRNQNFDTQAAKVSGALLTLTSFGLTIPAATQFNPRAPGGMRGGVGGLLFLISRASRVGILPRQKAVTGKEGVKANLEEKGARPDEVHAEPQVGWSRNQALGILALVTIGLAAMSEVLT